MDPSAGEGGPIDTQYQLDECIFEGSRSLVFRGRSPDGTSVIVKRLRDRHPTADARTRFAREHDITRSAEGPGVVAVLDWDPEAGLVLEDIGAQSVASILAKRRLSASEALDVLIPAVKALDRIHQADIVHRDINPSNIVYNPQTGDVRLIDFGIAQVLSREVVHHFEGTPAYIAPEQTGRMNRPIDHRADLYAVGATLYQLLTGRTPFRSKDRLELVHAHIARQPEPANRHRPDVPGPLAEIAALLLQKRAEERYQSARGLLHDLRHCRAALETSESIPSFTLRSQDVDAVLRVPQILYGRDGELDLLSRAWEAVAAGAGRLLLVAGYSGIGKTSLVHEVHRLSIGERARYAEGKFDQFRRGRPYDAVIQAVRDLVGTALADSDAALETLADNVRVHIGENAPVLVELVSELAHLLGPQPEPAQLPPSEARNRLMAALGALVQGLASAERPLVVFLDDLQWADLPSLELLEGIASDPELAHVLLIGAFRDNEVHTGHPLNSVIDRLGASVDVVTLGPLAAEDVGHLVHDTVHGAPGHEALASVCHDRTQGNPFFLNRFLDSLWTDGQLQFDTDAASWTWDLDALASRPVTDNVVDFMTQRISRLEADARAVPGRAPQLRLPQSPPRARLCLRPSGLNTSSFWKRWRQRRRLHRAFVNAFS